MVGALASLHAQKAAGKDIVQDLDGEGPALPPPRPVVEVLPVLLL